MNNIEEEIKDKIIDQISTAAGGRLIISKPEKKSFGEDLLIGKRADYKGEDIFLKVCSLIGPTGIVKLAKDFLSEEFKTDKNFYFLFIYFDSIKQKIGDSVWLVPSTKLKDIAKQEILSNNKKFLRVEILLNTDKKDKYSEFLIPSKNLGKIILGILSSKKD